MSRPRTKSGGGRGLTGDLLVLDEALKLTTEQIQAIVPTFTECETAVMDRVVRGLTNAAIARELFRSESVIKGHLMSAAHKLGAHNRTLAAVLYDRQKRGAA